VAAAAVPDDRDAAAGGRVQRRGELLHALGRAVGAVDVQDEARRVPVADQPQPTAQQQRLVRREEPRHDDDGPLVA
jgi:hypothetical protein